MSFELLGINLCLLSFCYFAMHQITQLRHKRYVSKLLG
ncbi:hypothetical protein N825_10930 [Skermanella stibiiresistens SB22]|uniref:Uncharacterized protein n=1 Tax=Skermanella stibiiresistens SB22 TaxID=1385369 RepID=W9GYB5_9PROT|nr:hypothetical protein N825_10930 [Skermanella stibiiresistens SB22]